MMTEQETLDLLSDYVEGRLDRTTRQAVEDGLRRHPEARRSLEGLKSTVGLLGALPKVAAPKDLRGSIARAAAERVRLSQAGRRMLARQARIELFARFSRRLLPIAAVLAVGCLAAVAVYRAQQSIQKDGPRRDGRDERPAESAANSLRNRGNTAGESRNNESRNNEFRNGEADKSERFAASTGSPASGTRREPVLEAIPDRDGAADNLPESAPAPGAPGLGRTLPLPGAAGAPGDPPADAADPSSAPAPAAPLPEAPVRSNPTDGRPREEGLPAAATGGTGNVPGGSPGIGRGNGPGRSSTAGNTGPRDPKVFADGPATGLAEGGGGSPKPSDADGPARNGDIRRGVKPDDQVPPSPSPSADPASPVTPAPSGTAVALAPAPPAAKGGPDTVPPSATGAPRPTGVDPAGETDPRSDKPGADTPGTPKSSGDPKSPDTRVALTPTTAPGAAPPPAPPQGKIGAPAATPEVRADLGNDAPGAALQGGNAGAPIALADEAEKLEKAKARHAAQAVTVRYGGAVVVRGRPEQVYALMREALARLEASGHVRWSAPPEQVGAGQLPSLTLATDDPAVLAEVMALLPKSPDVAAVEFAPSPAWKRAVNEAAVRGDAEHAAGKESEPAGTARAGGAPGAEAAVQAEPADRRRQNGLLKSPVPPPTKTDDNAALRTGPPVAAGIDAAKLVQEGGIPGGPKGARDAWAELWGQVAARDARPQEPQAAFGSGAGSGSQPSSPRPTTKAAGAPPGAVPPVAVPASPSPVAVPAPPPSVAKAAVPDPRPVGAGRPADAGQTPARRAVARQTEEVTALLRPLFAPPSVERKQSAAPPARERGAAAPTGHPSTGSTAGRDGNGADTGKKSDGEPVGKSAGTAGPAPVVVLRFTFQPDSPAAK